MIFDVLLICLIKWGLGVLVRCAVSSVVGKVQVESKTFEGLWHAERNREVKSQAAISRWGLEEGRKVGLTRGRFFSGQISSPFLLFSGFPPGGLVG